MKRISICFVAAVGLLFIAGQASAQAPGGMASPGMRSETTDALMKVFGKNTSFSADAEMKTEVAGRSIALTVTTAVSEGKMYSEMDMGAMKGAELPPAAVSQMKALGMDKMVTLFDTDANKLLMIYPNVKAYTEMPLPKKEATTNAEPKIEKTELGKETVDGHPTVKNKVVVTTDSGKSREMTLWNATDLKDFPVKIAMDEAGNHVEILYKNVKLGKPDPKLFEAPADFKRYESLQELMMVNIRKSMGGANGLPNGIPQGLPQGTLPKKQVH